MGQTARKSGLSALISDSIPNFAMGISQQPGSVRADDQGELQINGFSSLVNGLSKRPPSEHVAAIHEGQLGGAFISKIDRDVNERYIVTLTNGDAVVHSIDGSAKEVSFPDGKGYLNAANPASDFVTLTLADYTFVVNKQVRVRMRENPDKGWVANTFFSAGDRIHPSGGIKSHFYECVVSGFSGTSEPAWPTLKDNTVVDHGVTWECHEKFADHLSADRGVEAIVFIKAINYEIDYEIHINGAKCAEYTSPDEAPISTVTAALDLKKSLEDSLGTTDWEFQAQQSVLWIRRKDSANFDIRIEDSRGNTQMKLAKEKVQQFSDLPTVAPTGFLVEIIGDNTSNFDNYYVEFQSNNESVTFDEGTWVETVKPGIPWQLDPKTMPHALIRDADGSFSFELLGWGERIVGDKDSSLTPSFVGERLNDIYFTENRLGLTAGDDTVLSRKNYFFDFFPSTVTTVVDTDPVDTAASFNEVVTLNYAVPWQEQIIFFSDQAQFILKASDNRLTPLDSSVNPLTNFISDPKAKPVVAGRTIFFPVKRGEYSGIQEYFTKPDSLVKDAANTTKHVDTYIPKDITKMATADNEDILVVLSESEPSKLFINQYYWRGNEKLQNAWHSWDFGSGAKILSIDFIESVLYLATQRPDAVYLEKINVAPGALDTGESFRFHLDRKITEADCESVSYNPDRGDTTFILPYECCGEMNIITRGAGGGKILTITNSYDGSNRITVNGDLLGARVFIGQTYTFRYRISPRYLKETTPSGSVVSVQEGRLQLRRVSLHYGDSGYFRVEVIPEYREMSTYTLPGRIVGEGSNRVGKVPIVSGVFHVPIMSKNDRVKIDIVSDSFLPVSMRSGEWEGHYTIRSNRI